MKSIRIFSVVTMLTAVLLCSCQTNESSFVSVKGGKFTSKDYPSHFLGTNFWYGAILASEGQGGDMERLEKELDILKENGLTNLRILVGGDGPDGVPTRIMPTLQKEPGVYNDTIFRGLDRLLVEMAERGMKAVLYMNNSWEWSGGYGMYLEWAGEGKAVIPAEVGYRAYCESVSRFITNDKAKELFADHVRHVVSRTNTVTGKPYKDDPVIFSWQIGNEPRCFSHDSLNQQMFADWMWETAALIKSIDPNHMVSSGSEGYHGCEQNMELFEKIHSCPDIDYINIHIWPYNWSWVRENTLQTNLQQAMDNTDAYIDMHMDVARRYGKPVVLEEFGFPRDGFQFAKGTPTTSRDRYYKHVCSRIVKEAQEGGLFAGLNFWGWGGLAEQSQTNIYWQPGDDYCGDPAQEQQGLNSVYAFDESTLTILKEAAAQVEEALGPKAWFHIDQNRGLYFGEGPHTLKATAMVPKCSKATLEMTLTTDLKQPVKTESRTVKFSQGGAELEYRLNLQPGFYCAVLELVGEDGSRKELARTNIGYEPEKIESPQDKQPDFDQFWLQTLAQLEATAPEYRLTLIKERSNDIRRTYRVDMTSLGGENISGILVEPVKEGKYETVIAYMGYGSEVWYPAPSDNPQRVQFLLCHRNQALNRKPGEKDDWCVRGLESKDTYYYRGAFADAVRAIDFVCSREKVDQDRLFAEGGSQGGALTLIAASLDHRIDAIAPSVPFLSDYKDYFQIVHWPAEPILKAAADKGISDEDLYKTLSYFDVKNFTDRIQCPVLMAFGLQDPVCPPHTNFSGYNMIRAPKRWICYPFTGHDVWRVPQWPQEVEKFYKENSTKPE